MRCGTRFKPIKLYIYRVLSSDMTFMHRNEIQENIMKLIVKALKKWRPRDDGTLRIGPELH